MRRAIPLLALLLVAACSSPYGEGVPPQMPSRDELIRACPAAAKLAFVECPARVLEVCPPEAASPEECPQAEKVFEDCDEAIDNLIYSKACS